MAILGLLMLKNMLKIQQEDLTLLAKVIAMWKLGYCDTVEARKTRVELGGFTEELLTVP